jgi:hypothetical protein
MNKLYIQVSNHRNLVGVQCGTRLEGLNPYDWPPGVAGNRWKSDDRPFRIAIYRLLIEVKEVVS